MAKTMTWAARIKRARKQGMFTPKDVAAAGEWSQCAVGEVGLPKDVRGREYFLIAKRGSYSLEELGMEFSHRVASQRIEHAALTYEKIQAAMKLPAAER